MPVVAAVAADTSLAAVVTSHIAAAVRGTATAVIEGTATAVVRGTATASSRCSSGGKAVAVVTAAAAGQVRTCLISFSIESCHSAIDCS